MGKVENIKMHYHVSNKHKEVIAFGDPEVEKPKFHQRKKLIFLEYSDIKKIEVSSMVSSDLF